MARLSRGKLTVAPLPPSLQLSMWEPARRLQLELEEELPLPVDLWLTDNRRSLVSIQKGDETYRFRLHHMFVEAGSDELNALVDLANGASPRQARDIVRTFARAHSDRIRKATPKRRTRIKTAGRHHELIDRFAQAASYIPEETSAVAVTWGRFGHLRPLTKIRLGSYCRRRQLVRVHPLLDQSDVPDWVVEFIIFHELLHHITPSRRQGRRRVEHGADFKQRERAHPDFERFEEWCDHQLQVLMAHPNQKKTEKTYG